MKKLFYILFCLLISCSAFGKEKKDSIYQKSIELGFSPKWVIAKQNEGSGWNTDLKFSWNKKRISFSVGFFYTTWKSREKLLHDSVHYYPLGFDPAGGSTPQCYNCRSEQSANVIGILLNSEYHFRICNVVTFAVGTEINVGYINYSIAMLDSNNNTIINKIALGVGKSGDYYSVFLFGNFYAGTRFKITNSIDLKVCPFLGTYLYKPYFMGINFSINLKL